MRDLKSRLKKLEGRMQLQQKVVRLYWADGTFLGRMNY